MQRRYQQWKALQEELRLDRRHQAIRVQLRRQDQLHEAIQQQLSAYKIRANQA